MGFSWQRMIPLEEVKMAFANAAEAHEDCKADYHIGCDCSINGGDLVDQMNLLFDRYDKGVK